MARPTGRRRQRRPGIRTSGCCTPAATSATAQRSTPGWPVGPVATPSSPTPTSTSSRARSTNCSPWPAAGRARRRSAPRSAPRRGSCIPPRATCRGCRPAPGMHCSVGSGPPTPGRRATGGSGRSRGNARPAGCRARVSWSTSRRSGPSADSTPATSCTSRTSTWPSGWAGAAGCTSTRPRRWSCTRAGTRPAESRTAWRGCTTPARCAICPGSTRAGGTRRSGARSGPASVPGCCSLTSVAGWPPAPGSSDPRRPLPASPVGAGGRGDDVRHAVIMAGGSGTRLWPLSRAARPKQLLDVVAEDGGGAHSLLAEAFARLQAVLPTENIWVCTAARYGEQVRAALPELGAGRLILEPVARDTANAVGLAAALVADLDPDAELAVVSADHVIRPVERFAAALGSAFDALAVRSDALVTLGIRPTAPATGFGYVQRGAPTGVPGVAEAAAFREKPDLETAKRYLASGEYLWNSGMFVWRARTVLDALADHLPATARGLARVVAEPAGPGRDAVLAEVFPALPKISIDYAVLEPAAAEPGRVLVADLDVEWLDVGSWPALAHTLDGADDNAVRGLAVTLDSAGNIVFSEDPGHLVALAGVRNSVVVATRDVTMVCPVSDAERVKALLAVVEERHGSRFS